MKRRDGQYAAFDNRAVLGVIRYLTNVPIPSAVKLDDADTYLVEALGDVDLPEDAGQQQPGPGADDLEGRVKSEAFWSIFSFTYYKAVAPEFSSENVRGPFLERLPHLIGDSIPISNRGNRYTVTN